MLPLRMHWRDLLFAHWPVSPALLRATLPPGLELDLFEGEAWVSVVPFDMSGVGLPGFDFAELNVRTYVVCDGRPGVWFYSLDAASKLAVRAARRFFHLNYCDAAMSVTRDGDAFEYRSRRTHRGMAPASLDVRYRPVGPAALSVPGSLDHWLTERYCLYSFDGHQLYRGEVRHEPWQLQPAEAEWRVLDMTQGLGFALAGPPRRLAFARHVAVRAGLLEQIIRPRLNMTDIRSLRDCLAPLILDKNVPMEAVEAIGGIVERDARLNSAGSGSILAGTTTLEEMGFNLERYEGVLDQARSAVQKFSIDGDASGLIRRVIKIRDDIASLEQTLANERAARGNDTPFGTYL